MSASSERIEMLRLVANPPVLEDFLTREIEGLERLVDRAMKKKPKKVRVKREEKPQEAGVGV